MAYFDSATAGNPQYNQFLTTLSNSSDVESFYGGDGFTREMQYESLDVEKYMGDGDFGGQRLFADVISRQTNDYLNRFAPLEGALADSITATGTTSLEGDLERTRTGISGGITNATNQFRRNRKRYGARTGPEEDLSQEGMSAMVGGLNDTRTRDSDRRLAVLQGGLGDLAPKARQTNSGQVK